MVNGSRLACWALLAVYVLSALFVPIFPTLWLIVRNAEPAQWEWARLPMVGVQAAAFFCSMAGLGALVGVTLRVRPRSLDTRIVLTVAAGMGISGSVILALALLGLAQGMTLRILSAGQAVLAFWGIASGNLRRRPGRRDPLQVRMWLLLLLVSAWCGMWLAGDLLAPEGFWDALVYHLAVPARILEWHKFVLAPPFFSNFPMLMSMHYLVALAVRGEDLARGIALGSGVLVLWSTWRVARIWMAGGDALLATAAAGSMPLMAILLPHAGSDVGATMFGCLALYAVIEACPSWPRGRVRTAWLVAAGLLGGLAGAAKLPGLVSLAALGLCLLPYGRRALPFPVAAGVTFSAWMAKAWLLTGDPVFPFGAGPFRSPFWTAFSREAYAGELRAIWTRLSPHDFIPWGHTGLSVARFKLGLVGAVPGMAAVALLAAGRLPAKARMALLYIAASAAFWSASAPAYRFLLPGFILLPALFVAVTGRWSRWALGAAIVLHLAWYPVVMHQVDQPWAAARGDEAREDYYVHLHSNVSFDAFEFLNHRAHLRAQHRILASGEVRNYLAPPFAIVPSYFEPDIMLDLARHAGTPRRLYVRLRQRGVRFLLINVPELIRLRIGDRLCWEGPVARPLLEEFFREYGSIAYARGPTWVYEVMDKGRGAEIPECYFDARDLGTPGGYLLATWAQTCVAEGRPAEALRYGWAATAKAPRSGMVWALLGDALYANKRWDQAIGAYSQALYYNWKTSVVYRNQALALAESHNFPAAQQALMYARRIDPDSRRLQEDTAAVWAEWFRRHQHGAAAP